MELTVERGNNGRHALRDSCIRCRSLRITWSTTQASRDPRDTLREEGRKRILERLERVDMNGGVHVQNYYSPRDVWALVVCAVACSKDAGGGGDTSVALSPRAGIVYCRKSIAP